MLAKPMFASAPMRSGMYESFYLRAVSRGEPLGVWIRHTVSKPPGVPARGSVWCTVFDARHGRPFMRKLTSPALKVPTNGWIEVGARSENDGAAMGPGWANGACGDARWSLDIASLQQPLRHLPREWLYRAPLPRTKLTSPAPLASFTGELELPGRRIVLDGWPGMVGHNWGAEHAERWIWLHGVDFAQAGDAWLDLALGRVKLAGRMTPWVANGALSIDGRRVRLGGLGARGLRVRESAVGCVLSLPGERGARVQLRADVPEGSAAGWRYADPHGGDGHDVLNCSIASLQLAVSLPGERAERALSSAHGGVYELGMRERDHGVTIAPFADG